MQALLADLFPWVAGFALADAVAQLLRGHLLLFRAGGRFELLRAGLHFLWPWPWSEAVVVHDLPFLVDGDRVLVPDPRRRSEIAVLEPRDLGAVALDTLGPVTREGSRVVAGDTLLAAAPTAAWAESIRADLAELVAAPAEEREALRARQVAGRADVAEVRALRGRQVAFLPWLAGLATLAFALVFVVWPLAAWAPRRVPVPGGVLLAALGVIMIMEALVAFAMLRDCGEPAGRSALGALHLLLVPVAALHPLQHAGRGLYRRFHPWAVAAALLPPAALHTLAGRELRRARLSRAAGGGALAAEWRLREQVLAAVMKAAGPAGDGEAGRTGAARGAAAVCPLCGAAYVKGPTRCSDCDVALDRVG